MTIADAFERCATTSCCHQNMIENVRCRTTDASRRQFRFGQSEIRIGLQRVLQNEFDKTCCFREGLSTEGGISSKIIEKISKNKI